jgi:radical SAM superfamily enzyme YgiQ (UPF0313 family)
MIGLPGESDDDIAAISDMIYKISDLKRQVDGKTAHVTASINAFVPKPHTAFQKEPMASMEIIDNRVSLLRKAMKSRMVDIDFHSLKMAFLEAVFSRGDRRLAGVILEAWYSGARFDGWQDKFNFNLWMGAFEKKGIDPAFYANRTRNADEPLPWDFIDLTSRP